MKYSSSRYLSKLQKHYSLPGPFNDNQRHVQCWMLLDANWITVNLLIQG